MSYTIEQTKKAKVDLETSILGLLKEFEDEYKIKVRYFDIERKKVRNKSSKNEDEVGPINWEETDKQPIKSINIQIDFLELM